MTEHVPNMMYYERRRHKLDKCACLLYNTPLSFLIIHLITLLDNATPSYNATLDINLSNTSHMPTIPMIGQSILSFTKAFRYSSEFTELFVRQSV